MRSLAAMLSTLALMWTAPALTPSQALPDESLYVIVHAKARVNHVSGYELEALFTRAQTRWGDGTTVYPFSFPAGSGPRDMFDRTVLRLTPDQVGRFWLDRRIRGMGLPPKQVPSATMMVQIIANLPGSIGYVPATRNRTGVKVIARIVSGKVLPP